MLHKLAKAAGGQPVKLKTDCVVVQNGNDVKCSTGVGNYRTEILPQSAYEISLPFQNQYMYQRETLHWSQNCQGVERLLCGRAGTGKSWTIKEMVKTLDCYALLDKKSRKTD